MGKADQMVPYLAAETLIELTLAPIVGSIVVLHPDDQELQPPFPLTFCHLPFMIDSNLFQELYCLHKYDDILGVPNLSVPFMEFFS